ncbi:MAG TPA: hypothetical protein VEI52_16195 [Terriglobales bacterium]|nr:hypothetical protein [Terriglobales bacterium]
MSGSCTNRHNVGGWGIPCPVVGIVSHTLRLDQLQPTLARREGNAFSGKNVPSIYCGYQALRRPPASLVAPIDASEPCGSQTLGFL